MTLTDAKQRQQALDPNSSFIVQAPAGSGKTTLLTQRFLKLLSLVNKPEEILAITFTRKAANEMRERILEALSEAQQQPSEELTSQLAQQALVRNEAQQWQLLENPSRLQVKTIDSLCASLTKALPLLARFGAQPKISDQPNKLYQEAIDSLIQDLDQELPWQPAIARLLQHLDNNVSKVSTLLSQLLAKRDHWLPLIMACRQTDALRQQLEIGLTQVNSEILANVAQAIQTSSLADELLQLTQFASCYAPEGSLLTRWKNQANWPTATTDNKTTWLALTELLLTSTNQWRKTLNKNQGLPAASSASNKEEKAQLEHAKKQAKQLLEQLNENEALLETLAELKLAPPTTYTDQQWEILDALVTLLPIACAKLKLSFATHAEVDFNELLLASLLALGDQDAPTDLTLALDYRLQHILVDEFQDTSTSQIQLLEKLTLGWQVDEGRSLFLVGDPMQSIYRFRQAEVSLFLRCREFGLNDLTLTPLTLRSNFRSESVLIDWFNESFNEIFPKVENLTLGAVSYSTSHATKPSANGAIDYQLNLADRHDEAQRTVEIIQQNPQASVAILVQARHHLSAILPALEQADIAYQGIDLDRLIDRPSIQDLLSLTQALLDLDDRISWLALLRAPWCGLTLEDLLIISRTDEQETLWQRLTHPFTLAELTAEGAKRSDRLIAVLETALANRFRMPFASLVEKTWRALGGEALLAETQELRNCQAYFDCLRQYSQAGTITELETFKTQLNQLFATPVAEPNCRVQIMTIHKAKGLEFDVVILPNLERSSPGLDPQLMLWGEVTTHQQESSPLLAPVKASEQTSEPIYDYLNRRERLCLAGENRRLFYVAATRAKSKLYLLACQSTRLAKNSFLAYLLSAYPELQTHTADTQTSEPEPTTSTPLLTRLSANELTKPTRSLKPISGRNAITEVNTQWQLDYSRVIGTFTHRLLQQISQQGLSQWPLTRLQQETAAWRIALAQHGIPKNKLDNAINEIQCTLTKTLNDERGRWLLTQHPTSHAELSLSSWQSGKHKVSIIDRVFIDENDQLWLADFKTTHFNHAEPLEPQLATEKDHYAKQLKHYQYLAEQHFNQPVRCGLYFTSLPRWLEIDQ